MKIEMLYIMFYVYTYTFCYKIKFISTKQTINLIGNKVFFFNFFEIYAGSYSKCWKQVKINKLQIIAKNILN